MIVVRNRVAARSPTQPLRYGMTLAVYGAKWDSRINDAGTKRLINAWYRPPGDTMPTRQLITDTRPMDRDHPRDAKGATTTSAMKGFQ